jgi:choline dehydrogenase
MGATGWDYQSVLPYFKRSENYENGEDPYHGASGELGVSNLKNDHPCCKAWLDAAQQAGFPFNPDFNGQSDYGVGAYQLSMRDGWRSSAAVAFLRPALKRRNLTVLIHSHVRRVLFEGTTAVGVEWESRHETRSARAEQEVLLSAGTIQSPQLLQLSGVGPADILRQYGIDVRVDAPEVGENLKDHYQARTIVRLKDRLSLNDDVRNPLKLASMGLQWLLQNRGPLTVGAGQVGGFVSTPHATGGRADMQFNVMPLSVDKPGTPLHNYSGFTASACQCRPTSKGRLTLQSADPSAPPRIESRYLSEELDRNTLVDGVEILREIYHQPAFRDLIDAEVLPGAARQSRADLLDSVREIGGTVFHPVGTCRMGSDDRAVVNPTLQVQGVQRLRVIDASVMPEITSANTNAASIMIGERGAAIVMGQIPSNARREHAA